MSSEERIAELEKKLAELESLKSRLVMFGGVLVVFLAGCGIVSFFQLLKMAKTEAESVVKNEVNTSTIARMKEETEKHRDDAGKAAKEAEESKKNIDDLNDKLTRSLPKNSVQQLTQLDTNLHSLKGELKTTSDAQEIRLRKLEDAQAALAA